MKRKTNKLYREIVSNLDMKEFNEQINLGSMPPDSTIEAWDIFDSLPDDVRLAHKTIYTGHVLFNNQHDHRLMLTNLSEDTAQTILELDNGKYMLGAFDLCGSPRFG